MRHITLLALLFSTHLHAEIHKPIATVVKVRGTVSKLLPGALEATLVKIGDKLVEDTSVLTGTKSFIQIKFIDKTELKMGPESKIVISEMKADSKVGIISLLKGRIRAEVEKAHKAEEAASQNKFYIRTRTAALGVRGTDFQTIYNPDNRLTSLLTYKGAVAMTKVDEQTHERMEATKVNVIRDSETNAPVLVDGPAAKILDEKSELIKILEKKDAVVVLPGQTSFASEALKKSSLPVKISPVQLNALYKNSEFEEKNVANLKSGTGTKVTSPGLATAPQIAPLEGVNNPKTGEFAPRAGGFIDEASGLYIAPEASASFDEKNKVYVSEATGDFDADTGQYVAPKGLVLDAKLGFVLEKNADIKPQLLALKEDMNKNIAHDAVVGDLDGEVELAPRSIDEKFIRNRLSFSLMPGSEKLKFNETTEVESKDSVKLAVEWQIASTSRFTPLLGLSYASVDYQNLGAINNSTQDSKSLYNMMAGMMYAYSDRANFIAKLTLDQAHHAYRSSSTSSYEFKRIVVTHFNVGATYDLIRSRRWSLGSEFFARIGARKKFNAVTVADNAGLSFKLMPAYRIDEKKSVALGFFLEKDSSTLTGAGGEVDEERNRSGLELKFNFDL